MGKGSNIYIIGVSKYEGEWGKHYIWQIIIALYKIEIVFIKK